MGSGAVLQVDGHKELRLPERGMGGAGACRCSGLGYPAARIGRRCRDGWDRGWGVSALLGL